MMEEVISNIPLTDRVNGKVELDREVELEIYTLWEGEYKRDGEEKVIDNFDIVWLEGERGYIEAWNAGNAALTFEVTLSQYDAPIFSEEITVLPGEEFYIDRGRTKLTVGTGR